MDAQPGAGRAALAASVAQVVTGGGAVAGASFLVGDGVAVTCAHVVRAVGAGPGERVELVFPHLRGAPRLPAEVVAERWRAPESDDVAVLHLAGVPPGAEVLALGSAAGCQGHPVSSFGFPAQAPPDGHFGYGTAADPLPGRLLQLTGANDLTSGFSGGPVVDERTGLVIGMVTAIASPDEHLKGIGIAYATPAEVLREVVPQLAVREVCPYLGLEPFTAEHAEWFRGRDDAVGEVRAALRRSRAVLLLGPSGGGKSSLVQAGVLPALSRGALPGSDRWLPVVVRPGTDLPAELERAGLPGGGELAGADRRLAEADRDRLLLVVDQFEELLTQPPDLRHRAAGQLVALIGSGAPVSVLLVMRDDFYPQLAAMLPQLLAAATPGLVNIPAALRVPELLEIIGGPARAAGIGIETGLVERIVDDLCSADPDRRAPVTLLPPLELALRQLWQRREDGRLTHDAYQRIGAVTGALTTWCNTALAQLPARHRTVARRMLTALVRPADDAHAIPATRRQLSISTLRALAAGPADTAVDEVLAALTRYRIITTGSTPRPGRPPEPTAELIHDALLRDWPDLRRWVADDHRFQVWLHRAAEQRQRHRLSGQPGDLLAGTALSEGIDWAGERSLPADIAEFLTASHQSWQATARRTRRLNRLLAGLLVVSLVATGLALWQSQLAGTAQREAQARQLAAQSAALRETSPDLSALLAVQAHRTDDSTAEGSPALQAFADSPLRKRLDLHGGNAKALAYSTDGRLLAAAGEQGGTSLWETGSGRERHILRGHAGEVNAVAFSPGNSVLATAGQDRTARIWDVGSGRQRALLRGHESTVNNVEFSGDGTVVVTSSGDGTARIWDSRTGRQLRSFTVHGRGALEIAFSGDGRTLVTANNDGTAQLWDVETGRQRALVGDTGVEVFSVALSPDVRMLAAAGVDHRIRLWDLETGQERAALTGHFTYVFSMEFSPDGKTLASASLDTSARLWDVGTGEELHILTGGNASSMLRTAFSPDGRTLVTTDDDRVARLWDVESGRQRRALTGHNGAVAWAAFSPDGAPLATAAVDGTARLWEARAGEPRLMLAE